MSEIDPRPPSNVPAESAAAGRAPSRWDELPPNSIFAGRYRIERLLARGGMSGVYLAWQLPLNRPVALKVLVPIVEDSDGEASFQERFRLEARTLASLNHPNIVVLYDYGETEDGRFFLAMEYVDGPRLSDVIKEANHLPLQRALRIALQTCAALRYAHKQGVIHRDIKLSNIMVWSDHDQQEQVKVVDFGLVKLTENDQRLTSAGMVLGSPHFIAPEQARGQQVDHRADIYAIGVTLFCMLTGKPPYSGATATATILAHLTQPVPSLSSMAPDLSFPPGIESVVQKCLAKRVEDRYADMSQVIQDLGSMVEGSLPTTLLRADGPSGSTLLTFAAVAPTAPAPVVRRRWIAPAVIGAALLLCIGAAAALGLLKLFHAGQAPPPEASTASTAPVPTAPVPTEPAQAAAPIVPPEAPPVTSAPTATAETVSPAAPPAPTAAPSPPPEAAQAHSRGRTATRATQPASSVQATQTYPIPPAAPDQAAPEKATEQPDGWKQNDLKNPWGK